MQLVNVFIKTDTGFTYVAENGQCQEGVSEQGFHLEIELYTVTNFGTECVSLMGSDPFVGEKLNGFFYCSR